MRRTFLVGAGVGAALMYVFDPSWGRRRRAQLRERFERASQQVEAWQARTERQSTWGYPNGRGAAVREEPDIDWTQGESHGYTAMRARGGM